MQLTDHRIKCCNAVALLRAEEEPSKLINGVVIKSGERKRESLRESERDRESQRETERDRERQRETV